MPQLRPREGPDQLHRKREDDGRILLSGDGVQSLEKEKMILHPKHQGLQRIFQLLKD